jgi:hypothetical protein
MTLKNRGVASFDRHDCDDSSLGVDIPPHVAQRPADLVAAVTLFQSFIYAFGGFSVMLFFFVFTSRASTGQKHLGPGRRMRACPAVREWFV